LSFIIARR